MRRIIFIGMMLLISLYGCECEPEVRYYCTPEQLEIVERIVDACVDGATLSYCIKYAKKGFCTAGTSTTTGMINNPVRSGEG